ncbi:RING-H2 finger protein ATL66-like [Aristolochia californica]|uniref:RING-H2 finger protein ATL66-like n=1 Tax=Aristolochia californica TaxID=171875 RepID=UPI0035D89C06
MASQDSQPFHWHYGELDDKNFQIHGKGLLLIVVLFAVLLFFTLLCLYARWVCRYRRQLSPGPLADGHHHATNIPPLHQRTGLDPAAISSIPVLLHVTSPADDVQCSICLSNFVEGEKVKVLPLCHHTFHPECVDKWLRTHSSCPLCRAALGDSDPDRINAVV